MTEFPSAATLSESPAATAREVGGVSPVVDPPSGPVKATVLPCFHCKQGSSVVAPILTNSSSIHPIQFATKCWLTAPNGEPCEEVRVFSSIKHPVPILTEITPVSIAYPYISELKERGGYWGKIGEFLASACELHLVGQLEADPSAEEAAYRGSAVFLGLGAELFIRRWLGWRHPHRRRGPLAGGRSQPGKPLSPGRDIRKLRRKLIQARGTAFRNGCDRRGVADKLLFIFDLRDTAVHPVLDVAKARRKPITDKPTPGNVTKGLSYLGDVFREAGIVR